MLNGIRDWISDCCEGDDILSFVSFDQLELSDFGERERHFCSKMIHGNLFSRFLHCTCISTPRIPLSMWLLLYSPRHFPQCTTCSPLLLKFITLVPVKDSSVKPSELRRRLMMLCPDGIPSVFLGEDGRNCATAFPECFLWRMGISLAGLTGLTAPSRAFELWVTGSVLLFFSCHFIIIKLKLSKLLKMNEGHLPWPGSKYF